jgi:hypothetical protein
MNIRPRQVKIPVASHYGGESRAALYKKAARYPGLFVKDGRGVFVDLETYDKIIDARPPAVIKPKAPPKAKEAA